MKLLLTSSGIKNKSIEQSLLQLIGKQFSDTTLIFIPTSANLATDDKSWLVEDMYNFQRLHWKFFDIVDMRLLEKMYGFQN